MTREESLDTMVLYDRSIIAADTAKEWLAPWGATLGTIGLTPQHVDVGADWDARLEVWEEGDSVAVYELATRLADHLDAPDVEYDTDYMGTGKRVAALTQKAVKRLRAFLDENHEVDAAEWVAGCSYCGGSGVRCCEFGADREVTS